MNKEKVISVLQVVIIMVGLQIYIHDYGFFQSILGVVMFVGGLDWRYEL